MSWNWGDHKYGGSVHHQGEPGQCDGCAITGFLTMEMEDQEDQEDGADFLEEARRGMALSFHQEMGRVLEGLRAMSLQTDDPRVGEAARHLSFAQRLIFMYANEIDTVPVPDFTSWEKK